MEEVQLYEFDMVKGVIVYVDPLMFPWATSFYFRGLVELFGERNVKFGNRFFADIPNDWSRPNTFNFAVCNRGSITKYAIEWFDTNSINNKAAYEWCDVFGSRIT